MTDREQPVAYFLPGVDERLQRIGVSPSFRVSTFAGFKVAALTASSTCCLEMRTIGTPACDGQSPYMSATVSGPTRRR